jgi:hypothetical protein
MKEISPAFFGYESGKDEKSHSREYCGIQEEADLTRGANRKTGSEITTRARIGDTMLIDGS